MEPTITQRAPRPRYRPPTPSSEQMLPRRVNMGAITTSTGLVDHGKEGISGLGHNGGDDASANAGAEVDAGDGASAHLALGRGHHLVDLLREGLEDNELGHGVGDLLEEHGDEARVEALDETLLLHKAASAASEAVSVGGVGDQANTAGLKRAQGNVSNELGGSSRCHVDGSAVLLGLLHAELVNPVLLEVLITAELEAALEAVAEEGGGQSSEQGTSTLVLHNLSSSVKHTAGVGLRAQLLLGLDDINGGSGTVGKTAAESASKGKAGVKIETGEGRQGAAGFAGAFWNDEETGRAAHSVTGNQSTNLGGIEH